MSIGALYSALDGQRVARRLSWPGVAREINATFADVRTARPVAVSTLSGMRSRHAVEGNVFLVVLRWLDRTPESFLAGDPTPGVALPKLPPDRILRWDPPALHAALDAERRRRGLTWKQVAAEIPGASPSTVTGLAKARHVGFPAVMDIVAWLGQPAVRFTVARSH